ncbi:fimbrial protein [Enterobacter asburiae]|uniref:fimbrial protein n=1 Tax=Enterobacter asburiae TaxID=61645 RepID=UPI000444B259|nr:fimbrial protein [Enterobacter asburiae]AHW95299.1 hypothetical protein DI57_13135 [Enterobacter asburiae L1]QVK35455.1 fimbrial protein [Enterobacter asburiae]
MVYIKFFITFIYMCILCSPAFAHDGIVSISGTIQDNTCELAVDSKDIIIKMGAINGNQSHQPGDSLSSVPFSINLKNCGPAASEASVTFTTGTGAVNSDFYALDNEADSAGGIALGIYTLDGVEIKPGLPSPGFTLKSGQQSVELTFLARYVAISKEITAGVANVTATFVVNYS